MADTTPWTSKLLLAQPGAYGARVEIWALCLDRDGEAVETPMLYIVSQDTANDPGLIQFFFRATSYGSLDGMETAWRKAGQPLYPEPDPARYLTPSKWTHGGKPNPQARDGGAQEA